MTFFAFVLALLFSVSALATEVQTSVAPLVYFESNHSSQWTDSEAIEVVSLALKKYMSPMGLMRPDISLAPLYVSARRDGGFDIRIRENETEASTQAYFEMVLSENHSKRDVVVSIEKSHGEILRYGISPSFISSWLQYSPVARETLESIVFAQAEGLKLRYGVSKYTRGALLALLRKMTDQEKFQFVLKRWHSSYMRQTKLYFYRRSFAELAQTANLKIAGFDFAGDSLDELLVELISALDELPYGFQKLLEKKPMKTLYYGIRDFHGNWVSNAARYNPLSKSIAIFPAQYGHLSDSIIHEIAHHIDFTLPDQARVAFRAIGWIGRVPGFRTIKDEDKFPSVYATATTYEDFAESFRDYLLDSIWLKKRSPQRARFFERLELCAAMERIETCF